MTHSAKYKVAIANTSEARSTHMTGIRLLMRYKAWADDLFLSAVSSLPADLLTTPHPIVFGSLIRTLHHVYAMDFVWQCHLLGRPHGLTTRNPANCPDVEELGLLQRAIDAWYVAFSESMSDDELAEVVEFEFIGGGLGRMSRLDILFHVVNHTTYHRGHAAALLYGHGVSPPTTDLPVFLASAGTAS